MSCDEIDDALPAKKIFRKRLKVIDDDESDEVPVKAADEVKCSRAIDTAPSSKSIKKVATEQEMNS